MHALRGREVQSKISGNPRYAVGCSQGRRPIEQTPAFAIQVAQMIGLDPVGQNTNQEVAGKVWGVVSA